jgi:hypothetical protein
MQLNIDTEKICDILLFSLSKTFNIIIFDNYRISNFVRHQVVDVCNMYLKSVQIDYATSSEIRLNNGTVVKFVIINNYRQLDNIRGYNIDKVLISSTATLDSEITHYLNSRYFGYNVIQC